MTKKLLLLLLLLSLLLLSLSSSLLLLLFATYKSEMDNQFKHALRELDCQKGIE